MYSLKREEGFGKMLPIIALFVFLFVVTVTFFIIILEDRQPKEVVLNMKEVADNTGADLSTPKPLSSELLKPQEDVYNNLAPIAQFTATTPVYVGEKVTYEDLSYDRDLGGTIVNWRWEGRKDYYSKAGDYTVTLSVQDDSGQWSEPISHVIHVLDPEKEKYNLPPIACFKATNPVYIGETVVYEDCSYDADGGKIVQREWDGNQITFAKAGSYRVSLTVQDDQGKWSDPLYQYIEVRERPVVETQRKPYAIFDVSSPVYVGQTVTYTDKSYDPDSGDTIVKREWSANKADVYRTPGKYEVSLRVLDNHGAWSETYTKTIEVLDAPNNAPIANFKTNSPVYVNEPVTWENTSTDSDGIIAKEQWGGDKRYMYTEAGTYDVTLTVWDDRGAQGSITKTIQVLDRNNLPPVAKFKTNSPVSVGDRVYYWDNSYDEDGVITKVEWLGDKRDVYDKAGVYEVILRVYDDDGTYSEERQDIEVVANTNKAPVARISGPTEIHVNQTVTFKDESYDPDGYIVSNSWGSEFLSKTWNKPGAYYISLEVTDNEGKTSKTEVSIYVREEGYPLGPNDN